MRTKNLNFPEEYKDQHLIECIARIRLAQISRYFPRRIIAAILLVAMAYMVYSACILFKYCGLTGDPAADVRNFLTAGIVGTPTEHIDEDR